MGEILPRNDETLQERMADFQHQYDQLMFWINYKVGQKYFQFSSIIYNNFFSVLLLFISFIMQVNIYKYL